MNKETIIKKYKTEKAYREHNRQRYEKNRRSMFVSEIKSAVTRLRAVGCIVTPPPEDELNAAIDNYLANRPRRPRIDWEDIENEN